MNLVTRSQWGARAPRSVTYLSGSLQKGLAFHWEGPRMGTFSHDTCPGRIRTIQNFHMDTRGWADIAYNFVVCPHGYVFEGRGWGKRCAANGTNAGNDAYHAICYLGGEGDPFTAAAKQGFLDCVHQWQNVYGKSADIRPHSYFLSTACPGDVIRQWISSGLGGGVAPSPGPTGVKPMWDPPLQPFAAAWFDEHGHIKYAASSLGHVYAFGEPYYGNVYGQSWWGGRKVAQIGPRDDGRDGYMITATTGEKYRLP